MYERYGDEQTQYVMKDKAILSVHLCINTREKGKGGWTWTLKKGERVWYIGDPENAPGADFGPFDGQFGDEDAYAAGLKFWESLHSTPPSPLPEIEYIKDTDRRRPDIAPYPLTVG